MTHYVKIAIVLCACVALSTAQYAFGDFDNYFATAYAGNGYGAYAGAAAARDPRANPGPVVFPPSPPGDPSQTSGVVVGASGYGFVPTSSQGPSAPRYFYQGFFLR